MKGDGKDAGLLEAHGRQGGSVGLVALAMLSQYQSVEDPANSNFGDRIGS